MAGSPAAGVWCWLPACNYCGHIGVLHTRWAARAGGHHLPSPAPHGPINRLTPPTETQKRAHVLRGSSGVQLYGDTAKHMNMCQKHESL